MRRFASIIAACAVVSLAQPARAIENPPSWQVYNTANSDLPANRIFEVAADRLGRVWMSCEGLTLFDGDNWKNFSGLTVLQIGVAADNTTWNACDLFGGSLVHCDGSKTTSYTSSNSDLPSDWVTGVTVDNNNHVWAACAYTGIGEFDGEEWTKHLSSEQVGGGYLMMAHDRNNTIWMVNGPAVMRYKNDEWTKIEVPGLAITDQVKEIVVMPDGSIWVGTSSLGVGHYDGTEWKFHSTAHKELPANSIQALAVDSSGVLWVGTPEGLTSFNGSTWLTHHKDNWVLPDNNVRSIAIGHDNSLWIGTDTGGLLHAVQATTGVPEAGDPLGLMLSPNPVQSDVVVIRFSLPVPAQTDVEMYSLSGERVAVVATGVLSAGDHNYTFDNTGLVAGSYYCVVKTAGQITSHIPFIVYR